jgi:hypothetical protein
MCMINDAIGGHRRAIRVLFDEGILEGNSSGKAMAGPQPDGQPSSCDRFQTDGSYRTHESFSPSRSSMNP